jgi:hypothetical protein
MMRLMMMSRHTQARRCRKLRTNDISMTIAGGGPWGGVLRLRLQPTGERMMMMRMMTVMMMVVVVVVVVVVVGLSLLWLLSLMMMKG